MHPAPIAVTGAQRMPTVAESGLPEFESTFAYGILAPRSTPGAVLEEIRAQIACEAVTGARCRALSD